MAHSHETAVDSSNAVVIIMVLVLLPSVVVVAAAAVLVVVVVRINKGATMASIPMLVILMIIQKDLMAQMG